MQMIEASQVSGSPSASPSIPFWRQLRWNLIGFAILLSVIPVLLVGIFVLQQTRAQTLNQVNQQLESIATLKQSQLTHWLDTSNQAMNVFLSNATATNLLANFAIKGSNAPSPDFVSATLQNGINAQGKENPAFKEFFLYTLSGEIIASSNPDQVGKIVTRQPYFTPSLAGSYTQTPYYDISTAELTMLITRPVTGPSRNTVAVIAGRLNLDTLGNIMAERSGLGATGETYLVSIENHYLLTPSRFENYEMNRAYRTDAINQALSGQDGSGIYMGYRGTPVVGVYRWIPQLNAAFLAEIEETEAFALYNQTLTAGTFTILAAAVGAVLVALYYATRVSRPITRLTEIASRVAAGDLTQRVAIDDHNEIGLLAKTFNSMTAQLRDFVTTLEERVNERTRDLQIVADVSQSATTILNLDDLLQAVSNLTKERFGLYHAHIYLLDDAGENLVLAAGAGEAGRAMKTRGHSIPLNREHSLVARAARERKGVIVNDVKQAPDFLPNLLLPDTQSEMAVPMLVGDTLVGVLDVQAAQIDHFDDDDVRVHTTLAGQIAVAVQNARAFARVQQAEGSVREREQRYQQILDGVSDLILVKGEKSRIVWANKAFRDYYGMTQEELQGMIDAPFAEPDYTQQYIQDDLYVWENGVPLEIPEEPVKRYDGEVRLFQTVKTPIFDENGKVFLTVGVSRDISDRKEIESERQIIFETSNRLNAAHERHEVLEALLPYPLDRGAFSATLIYIDSDSDNVPQWAEIVGEWSSAGTPSMPVGSRFFLPEFPFANLWMSNPRQATFIEDVNTDSQVDDLTRGLLLQSGSLSLALLPLTTQGRWVGLITFSWGEPTRFTDQDRRIYGSMLRQTTSVVDALRAQEKTRKRAAELETVARVSAAATSILDIDELLQSVVDLTKESFDLYHAHVYLLDQAGENLVLAAGAGEAGRTMKARGHSIPLNREYSLVARAARERVGMIANDVTHEPHFLPNPLLPDTQSELAIPLVVADELIGVLDIQANVANYFHSDDVAVQSTLADQIAVAVQNARAFARVQQAEQAIRANQEQLLEAQRIARLGRWVWTPATGGVTWNELMYEHFGLPADTQPSFDLFMSHVHPDDVGMLVKIMEDTFQSNNDSFGADYRIIRADGTVRYHDAIGAITRDENGTPVRVVGTVHDITERKMQEQEHQILLDAANKLNNARTPDELLESVLGYGVQRGIMSATLMYIDNDAQGMPEWAEIVAVWSPRNPENSSLGMRFYLPEFPIASLWMANPDRPILIEDAQSSDLINPNIRAMMANMSGMAILPLYTQNRWVGLITLVWEGPFQFSEQDRRIFFSLTRQAAATVDAVRAYLLTEKRAAELQTVAQVSAAATLILDSEALLQSVVDLAKESFDLYHAHVYLVDEAGENLVLAAGAGEVGRLMKEMGRTIPIAHPNSLVARAARNQEGVISNDVTQDAGFLPNPMLPETRSEMAVPLIVVDQVIGVLDVQASTTNRFTQDDMTIQSTLADQIAVAVQNARAFKIQQETAERLREVDRLKSQFLANMSHELRTPLNSIIGYAEVLLDGIDGELSDEAIEDVEAIHSGGKHLLTIINDILDLAKIEAGQMFMDRQEANLIQVVDEVVSTCQILAKNKDISLNVELDGDIPAVYGDPIRLKQIVYNLVNNAIKFTEQGGVTVNLGVVSENNEVVVAVRDTGIGMTEQDIAGLFQQFHQVDGSATRRAGGTGLGLVITRHLVHMHEGEIYVESEKDVGSTFWFTLPIYTSQPNQNA